MDKDPGTNFVLVSVRTSDKISILMAPLIFISSTITHLLGGSAGREGAAIQLGGSIGGQIGRLIKLDEKDERLITMCGMSAAFAALFGTPITAAVFSMEVISVGVMYYSAIVPCVLSAVIGTKLASYFGVAPTAFEIFGVPELTVLNISKTALLAVLCALLSILFCIVMHKSSKLYSYIHNRFIRAAIGGVIVIVLTLVVGNNDYNGAGMDVIVRAINGEAKYSAFILKILFTAVTLGAGFKGGEIVPVFYTGSTFGNIAAKTIGLSPSFGAGIGLVSLFCGVTNCPLTSFVLSVELFGSNGFVYFALSCAVCYMLSGYHGLYKEQKIIYSKFKPEFVDIKAK